MIKFTKMHGLGNDYVYIDNTKNIIKNASELAKYVSDRHFGVGADGLILICSSAVADFKMQMFNQDGSEAEMCGNGIRCVGKFVFDKHLTNKTYITIETLAGIKKLWLNVSNNSVSTIKVDMGEPEIIQKGFDLTILDRTFKFNSISIGNPHAITIIKNVSTFNVEKYGKEIEIYSNFPNKTNVEFLELIDSSNIKMRVWERGSGETLACGTGACASVVSLVLDKINKRSSTVQLLGGDLYIEWNKEDNHIYMTGPATTVFDGILNLESETIYE